MKLQPLLFEANPQAMAISKARQTYTGHPDLGAVVDRDTWLTPRYILDQLGAFDLDPCAADAVPQWAAARYLTKRDNGLVQPWTGRVFMNPPFSDTAHWIEKHAEHRNGISLLPAANDSNAWRKHVWAKAHAILLLHGRVRFCNPDGSATTGRPLRGVALVAWTPDDAAVLRATTLAGVLLQQWSRR